MENERAGFVFAVCQLGAEPALKAEVLRAHPGWRFAFSRPGLITWRTDAPVPPEQALDAVFARASGISLGPAADAAAVPPLLPQWKQPPLVHVFERDRARPGEERPGDEYGPLAAATRAQVLAAGTGRLLEESRAPRKGEVVLDVVVAPDEPLLVGYHVHGPGRSPHPGGRAQLVLPPEAPSRAWLKIEQALQWSSLPVRRGQVAVEIGAAPGGTSWALLQRGLKVVGVDRGAVDPRVLAHPGFTHCFTTLGDVRREELPRRVDWLLMDVSLAPQVALHGVRRLVSGLRPALRGVIFTLKLNDWRLADEVPALLGRVAAMGLTQVRATQLEANRQEICVVAETRPRTAASGPYPTM